jgi:hypothetical protein
MGYTAMIIKLIEIHTQQPVCVNLVTIQFMMPRIMNELRLFGTRIVFRDPDTFIEVVEEVEAIYLQYEQYLTTQQPVITLAPGKVMQ